MGTVTQKNNEKQFALFFGRSTKIYEKNLLDFGKLSRRGHILTLVVYIRYLQAESSVVTFDT